MKLIAGHVVFVEHGTDFSDVAQIAGEMCYTSKDGQLVRLAVAQVAGEMLFTKDEAEELARAIGPRAHFEPVGEWDEPGHA